MPDVPEKVLQTVRNPKEIEALIDHYSDDWRRQNLEVMATRQRHMMRREAVVEGLLVIETLLVLLILFGDKVLSGLIRFYRVF